MMHGQKNIKKHILMFLCHCQYLSKLIQLVCVGLIHIITTCLLLEMLVFLTTTTKI